MEERKNIKSYVLRASRMSSGQKKAIETLSDKYCIEYKRETIDFRNYFRQGDVCIEIGFGMGVATAEIAAKNPDMNYIGIEVHKPGVGRLLAAIEKTGLKNLMIINHDAVEVLTEMIPDNSITGVHIFFPDPWPKKKHHKRRLINTEFVSLLRKKLTPDGYIYAATDWEDYAGQMLKVFNSAKGLKNQFDKWAESPVWRPETAFERKGINKNHVIRELYYKSVK